MTRQKYSPDSVRREIYLPVDLAAILEVLMLDPVKGKARYGSINTYLIGLIRSDLRSRGLLDAVKKPLDSGAEPPYNSGEITPPASQEPL